MGVAGVRSATTPSRVLPSLCAQRPMSLNEILASAAGGSLPVARGPAQTLGGAATLYLAVLAPLQPAGREWFYLAAALCATASAGALAISLSVFYRVVRGRRAPEVLDRLALTCPRCGCENEFCGHVECPACGLALRVGGGAC